MSLVRIKDVYINSDHVVRVCSDPASLDATHIVLDNGETIRIENDLEWDLESIALKIRDRQLNESSGRRT